MLDVVIIGNGPAGISAALYTRRAGLNTLIIGRDSGSLAKAGHIENYYGFSEPISGHELIKSGIAAAKRLGVDIISDEVVSIGFNESLVVKTKTLDVEAQCVIIATGSARNAPKIEGLAQFEGRGVSYCSTCDGFFFRGKDVCVLGEGSYALSEAHELAPIAKSVSIVTNGAEPSVLIPDTFKVYKNKILSISGDTAVEEIIFEDGTTLKTDGVFVAFGVAGSTDLAKKVGAITEGTKIVVDENMATNIPGLFAAGDCTAGMLQISKAVYEGAKAGTEAIKYVRQHSARSGGKAN